MKHLIISKKPRGIHNSVVTVELKPDSPEEREAIKNVETLTATSAKRKN